MENIPTDVGEERVSNDSLRVGWVEGLTLSLMVGWVEG